ncbi:ATPase [Candidatus Kaiserbacteria bacterium RIFCSPHIGHO2_02_FULL_49_34]|uniref:ATPase n=1 Tax=Candidatus Kaiserbacteria bacterium RIFCSPHIGHO2_02_FULL_49_34 TaxID=1798491 RepID=A0A1F6DI40_9BACT|nr:MAG: ATPase [Candidatus Kaiserbacteria bacterium RIFCSPHIGHO2_02_FULL_49_34]
MTPKIDVLDTNVLIHDPDALLSFKENKVIIPMIVLAELDALKDRTDREVSHEARLAIKNIDKILGSAETEDIIAGVPIPRINGTEGLLAIYPDKPLVPGEVEYLATATHVNQENDNIIINATLRLQKENPEVEVVLVTKDINMRLRAKAAGVRRVEDYKKDQLLDDINLLPKGRTHYEGAFWDIVDGDDIHSRYESGRNIHEIPRSLVPDAYACMFLTDDSGRVLYVESVDETSVIAAEYTEEYLMSQEVWGIHPKNIEQAMALHLLMHDDVTSVTLNGPAGSGKTILALACAIELTMVSKRFKRIVATRNLVDLDKEIGFLPGTETEKMLPWLAAITDNLEALHRDDESKTGSIDYILQKVPLEFKSLNFMRGRSFIDTLVILDEAQGLTPHQIKAIATRIGVGSKIIVLGNLGQIDSKYITPLTSGLTHYTQKLKGFKGAGTMQIPGGARSELAEFVEQNM